MARNGLFILSLILMSTTSQAETYFIQQIRALDRYSYYQMVARASNAKIEIDCTSIFQNLSVGQSGQSKVYYLSEQSCLQTVQFFTRPSWQKRCLSTFENHFEYGNCK